MAGLTDPRFTGLMTELIGQTTLKDKFRELTKREWKDLQKTLKNGEFKPPAIPEKEDRVKELRNFIESWTTGRYEVWVLKDKTQKVETGFWCLIVEFVDGLNPDVLYRFWLKETEPVVKTILTGEII